MTVINTNFSALNAQNGSRVAQMQLQTAMDRLSSGLRINSAKDDASGLAVATRMTADINSYGAAMRNAHDGSALAQTAGGGLGNVSNILQRMRELAVRSANGAISNDDRANIQVEITQLVSQVDSISKTTTFNGLSLLDGSSSNLQLQTGINAGQIVNFGIGNVSSKALGLQGYTVPGQLVSGRLSAAMVATAVGDLQFNGKNAFSAAIVAGDTAATVATKINGATVQTGVTATAYNTLSGAVVAAGTTFAAGALSVNGTAIGAAGNVADFVAHINRDASGVTAVLNSDNTIGLSNDTGNAIVIAGTAVASAGFTAGTFAGYVSLNSTTPGANIVLQRSTTGSQAQFNALGLNQTGIAGTFNGGAVSAVVLTTADDVRINGVKVGVTTDASAATKASAINALTATTGVTASALNQVFVGVNFAGTTSATAHQINGVSVDLTVGAYAAPGGNNMVNLVAAINSANTGATASSDALGRLVLTSQTGADIKVGDAVGGVLTTAASSASPTLAVAVTVLGVTTGGVITLASNNNSTIRVEDFVAGSAAKLGLAQQGGSNQLVGGALSLATQAGAVGALTAIDAAITTITLAQGNIGAIQNRLDTTVNNLQSLSTNLTSARSQVQDTDFSAETTNLARSQILSQAANAILAQANSSQQQVLSLLPRN